MAYVLAFVLGVITPFALLFIAIACYKIELTCMNCEHYHHFSKRCLKDENVIKTTSENSFCAKHSYKDHPAACYEDYVRACMKHGEYLEL